MAKSAAPRSTKSVWVPEPVEVEIGWPDPGTYEIWPRPVVEALELDSAIRRIAAGDWFREALATTAEQGTEGDAEEPPVVGWQDIKGVVLRLGYEPLKIAIPELKMDDFERAPFPQLEQVFNVVLDVNGLGFLRSLAKNLAEPLVAALKAPALAALAGAMASFLERQVQMAPKAGGETSGTES